MRLIAIGGVGLSGSTLYGTLLPHYLSVRECQDERWRDLQAVEGWLAALIAGTVGDCEFRSVIGVSCRSLG